MEPNTASGSMRRMTRSATSTGDPVVSTAKTPTTSISSQRAPMLNTPMSQRRR